MLPLFVALSYALALFAFASWADRSGGKPLFQRLRPSAYALAIAVYCTSWTYYGAVGSAVTDGWSYLPIYLGPIIVYLFGHNFLKKLVDAFKAEGANSLSDFIGGRFGNSRGVAAMVTILALLGSIPYLALQLRSLSTTFGMISGEGVQNPTMAFAALGLALFAIVYGTRRYDPASRNDAVLFAVGFESFFKLGALLIAGALAILLLASLDGARVRPAFDHLSANFAPTHVDADFFVITMLSMAAIFCLPRQFYVTVIEARSGDDIRRARWPFIGYMVLTLLVVLPISAAGLAILPGGIRPDTFVLELPIAQGLDGLALIVFLGGFSAATAMVVVETIALATMVSNDLFAPSLLRNRHFAKEGELGRVLLMVRRATIIAIMGSALIWALAIQDSQRLASIGLVAFAAMAQFAPILILAVYGANRDALAAKAGLGVGLLLWCYTLAMPQVLPPAMLDRMAGTMLNPVALLGIDGLSPISHGTLWSLGANLAVFSLVTMRRVQPAALPSLFREVQSETGAVATIGELKTLVARFVGAEVADSAFGKTGPSEPIDRATARKAERLIAGVVGLPSARAFLSSALHGSELTHAEVARLLDDTGQSLRFSKGLLAATLENIDPGVSVIDRDLNIVAWNSRYLELFDYPPGMVHVGTPVANLIRYNAERGECGPGEVDSHVEKRLGHMRRGQPHSFERVRPDGRVLKTVGGPMPSGGYVMCFTDVTAEAQALAEVEKARVELEHRVEERTSELSAANLALADADAEKTRFLAAASHDLLQPLHAARLFSAALRRGSADAQMALLQKLDRSIESAETLLRSLLDISKLDAGGITPKVEPFRLRPLIVELAETMAPLAHEKGLAIRIGPGDATVESDVGLLRSAIQNFLSNAIRYTDAGGIVIGVRRRAGDARIDVIDSGPGIPDDKHGAIFREFERLSNSGDVGIGLGLAIVERTARLLGARISLRSRLGRGSRFSISVRRSNCEVPEIPAAAKPTGGPAKAHAILVVDDDPANCDALFNYLQPLGHRVDIASDARAALVLADQGSYDIALVDFNLGPGMDGIALGEQLLVIQPLLRVALVTAARPEYYEGRAQALGLRIFRKPLVIDALDGWLAEVRFDIAAE
ncbi:MAG: PAS-domain containing protein [Sphingomonadales bacterium]|nr:PAS-domain containing protein [Sphingomonadales bacterium]MBK9005063.1 PAS-domain containing protein [Sphingomonadales bacterium]MBK9267203.1 PAS-domain containing protein [Sphingomonadales bacterium]MBP6434865.1 PAS-domain containing protein [Sphingorhabdus sp.]